MPALDRPDSSSDAALPCEGMTAQNEVHVVNALCVPSLNPNPCPKWLVASPS
jgi:hypothetical protein